MRRTRLVIAAVGVAVICASLGPYVFSRIQWYKIDNGWAGASSLVACHSGTPLFAKISVGARADLPSVTTARFDSWIACNSINAHRKLIVSDTTHLDGTNKALGSLSTMRYGCLDDRLSQSQAAQCESAIFESIDWLLEEGVDINPAGSCGYLRKTLFDVLDAKMFEFLLSRGASIYARCPGRGVEIETIEGEHGPIPSTIIDELNFLLSLVDTDEFSEEEAQVLKMIMLATDRLDDT